MASAMANPWIKSTIVSLFRGSECDSTFNMYNRRAKVVQVTKVFENLRIIIVSDKENSIPVMLSKICMEEYCTSNYHRSLSSLKCSLIKLENWHISTTTQSASNRDINSFSAHGITHPFSILCSKLMPIGADDCSILGTPTDVNKEKIIKEILFDLPYIEVAARLGKLQFPYEKNLPDFDGKFHQFIDCFMEHDPLTWIDCKIPEHELNFLNSIPVCGHSDLIKLQNNFLNPHNVTDNTLMTDTDFVTLRHDRYNHDLLSDESNVDNVVLIQNTDGENIGVSTAPSQPQALALEHYYATQQDSPPPLKFVSSQDLCEAVVSQTPQREELMAAQSSTYTLTSETMEEMKHVNSTEHTEDLALGAKKDTIRDTRTSNKTISSDSNSKNLNPEFTVAISDEKSSEEGGGNSVATDDVKARAIRSGEVKSLLGRRVCRHFSGFGDYVGTVVGYDR